MPTEIHQPDITLASTTESQAELDHATGPNWREHFDPAKVTTDDANKGKEGQAGEPTEKKEGTETASASAAGKTASKEGQRSEDDDIPVGARKRIDRLTARLRETEEELNRARGTQRQPVERPKSAAEADPEPQLKDFKTWEEWNASHTRWVTRDEQRKLETKNAADRQQAEAVETYNSHIERLEAARTAHDDFDDVVKAMPAFEFSSPAASQAFQMALVEADNGPELMYHLATHPEEMAKFADLSPVKVQMMIGRLSDKLSSSSAAAARTTAKTNTPKPTTPVRGTSKAPDNIYDEATVKDTDSWIRQRQAQIRSSKNRAN